MSRRTITRDIDAWAAPASPGDHPGQGRRYRHCRGLSAGGGAAHADELQAILAGVKSLDGLLNSDHMAALAEKLGAGRRQVLEADDLFLIDLATYYKDDLAKKWRWCSAPPPGKAPPALLLLLCERGEHAGGWSPTGWYFIGVAGILQLVTWNSRRSRLFKLNRMWEAGGHGPG